MNFIFPAKRNETERSEGISRLNPVKETQISRLHCTMFRHEWSDGFRSHLKNEQKRREGKGEKGNLDALMDVGTRYCLAAGARKRYMALDILSLVRDTSRAAEHFSQQYLRDLARSSASSATGQVCSFERTIATFETGHRMHPPPSWNARPVPKCTENLPCNWSLWDAGYDRWVQLGKIYRRRGLLQMPL